jgi:heterodisulfide reductase subunit B
MKLGIYPGCSLEGSSREYLESLMAIAPRVGLELAQVPDWNCCGASAAHSLNHKLALALPARVLALAEQAGMDELLVPCSACYNRLAITRHTLANDEARRREIAAVIELPYTGKTQVVSVLHVFGRLARNGLRTHVSAPLTRKVACYYGCYLTRPGAACCCAKPEDPTEMDDIMRAVGAEPLDWAFKVECCGAGLSLARVDVIADLSGRIVADAAKRGAEAIIVACPMCHTNLDLRRDAILKKHPSAGGIPVLYLSQAIGLAFGVPPKELGLHRHHVPVKWSPLPAIPAPAAAGATKEA